MNNAARRALLILEEIGRAQRPVGAAEIGRRLSIPSATAFRDIDALERTGFAGRYQASSRYVLGTTAKRLRQTLFARFPIREICLPYLQQTAFACGETTSLTVRLGWYSVQIAAVPGTREVISAPSLGQVRLLTDGPASLAILAFQSDGTVERLTAWQRIRRLSPPPSLAEELGRIRRARYASESLGFSDGLAAISFPLLNAGRAVAALSIDGPVLQPGQDGPVDTLPHWREMLQEIEALIGKLPAPGVGLFDHLDPDDIALQDTLG